MYEMILLIEEERKVKSEFMSIEFLDDYKVNAVIKIENLLDISFSFSFFH
jgi:hypothetical protein